VIFWTPPSWLRKLLSFRWMGFGGVVMEGTIKDPDAVSLLAHEEEHIDDQDDLGRSILGWLPLGWASKWRPYGWVARFIGSIVWGIGYAFVPSFRLRREARAFVRGLVKHNPGIWEWEMKDFAEDLAGRFYLYAAPSVPAAMVVIRDELAKFQASPGYHP